MMELTPFWTWPENLLLTPAHQSIKQWSSNCGAIACSPNCYRMQNQNCRVKTQETNKWSIVSPTLSQSGHFGGWLRPLLASLSAVRHRLCATVHMKNLHFPGAQLFQILSHESNWVAPMNRAFRFIHFFCSEVPKILVTSYSPMGRKKTSRKKQNV